MGGNRGVEMMGNREFEKLTRFYCGLKKFLEAEINGILTIQDEEMRNYSNGRLSAMTEVMSWINEYNNHEDIEDILAYKQGKIDAYKEIIEKFQHKEEK